MEPQMTVTVSLVGELKTVADGLRTLADRLYPVDAVPTKTADPVFAPVKAAEPEETKAPAKKAKKVEEEVDLSDLDAKEEDEPKLTLDTLIDKFKDYAMTNSREAAAKILKKFKVKSVRDLKESDYAEVVKELA